jgi:hypothetical protein
MQFVGCRQNLGRQLARKVESYRSEPIKLPPSELSPKGMLPTANSAFVLDDCKRRSLISPRPETPVRAGMPHLLSREVALHTTRGCKIRRQIFLGAASQLCHRTHGHVLHVQ